MTDRVARLDIKSGQYTEYMLPRATNIRRVYVDDSKNPGALWIGSNHGASIVKVEPLDMASDASRPLELDPLARSIQ